MSNIISIAPKRRARVSSKLRTVIHFRVAEGLSIADACDKAAMSRQGWYRAMKRAEIRDLLAEVQAQFIASSEGKRAYLRALALDAALDLMLNSKSEAIWARMIEFLASDVKV